MSWADWSDVINVHLHGSFIMSRACATHFREQNSGSFVHMTSTSGLVGNFGQANYMAAKMGIVGLSRGIALDMARFNVRSNCVSPFAWTRMIDSIPAETEEEKARVARASEMTPEKIAPLVVYLASDRAAGISGQILSVRNNEIYLFSQTGRSARCIVPTAGRRKSSPSSSRARLPRRSRRSTAPATCSPGTRCDMTIVYDKLMALDLPPAEQAYGPKDCMLYALGVGLGHDPMNEDELAFVYEKNLKVLPTMATVLGHRRLLGAPCATPASTG